ncbi:MAG: methyltransferase domain-containing protein [Pseudomonadota bacterium]
MRLDDIDWNRMWQEARLRKSWKKKDNESWDKRAAGFAKRNIDSDYADKFLRLMQPEADWSVLDVGCGPGTLALPLAHLVKSVTAIDFSAAMLDELENRATGKRISNIKTIQASWTDDWSELAIPVHDVTVSSRSLSVFDLKEALEKLDRWALKKVFIVDRVGCGPFDPDIFAAIGRNFDPGPDYIFTVNLLHRMGIHPTIDYIVLDPRKTFTDKEDALRSCRWMLDDLTADEEKLLDLHVGERLQLDDTGAWSLKRKTPIKWAVISWEKKSN